jgi:O-methyltransferase
LPVEATPRDSELIGSLKPFTMTSSERLWSLINAVRHAVSNEIPGDFVECGVWRGGSVMAMVTELSDLGVTDRKIWLYDTFAGMTDPTAADVEAGTGVTAADMLSTTAVADGDNVWCVAGLPDVQANVRSTGYPFENFTFVEGDVAQTLKSIFPETISLLRLDTDWYESTRMELEVLYPRLAVGGVCIFDDYGHWQGARKAVDEYFEKLGHRPYMHPIDYSGRVLIKTQHSSGPLS